MRGFRSDVQYCSFCGKPGDDKRHLVAAPTNNIFICDKCIAVCEGIVAQKEKSVDPIDMTEVPSPKEFKKSPLGCRIQPLQENVKTRCNQNRE